MQAAGGLLGRVPFREVWIAVAVLLAVGEQFPFSNFPMYSSMDDEAFYFEVTNAQGEVLPYATVFRFRASHASKAFRSERKKLQKSEGLSEEEAGKKAGLNMLNFMLARAEPVQRKTALAQGLKFVEVRVKIRKDDLETARVTHAEIPPR